VKEDTQEGVERIHRKVKRKYTGRIREVTNKVMRGYTGR
jgi:hypothetical protein